MARVRPLDPTEVRVLGALLEKEQATPDAYPLTVNSLLSACNQKTNREPVTDLTEGEVWDALEALRQDVLVWRVEGARVERFEHRLDRRWHLTPARKAVLTLLLLRGPQTPGELRSRSGRLHDFESVDEVDDTLRDLASGDEPLVVELPRQPGQRETRWTHTVGTETTEAEPAAAPTEDLPTPAPTHRPAPSSTPGPADEVLDRLQTLEDAVAELRRELEALKSALGE